ncbi:MAG: hypothetical protein ACKPFH_12770 [Dolichospermum sp.]
MLEKFTHHTAEQLSLDLVLQLAPFIRMLKAVQDQPHERQALCTGDKFMQHKGVACSLSSNLSYNKQFPEEVLPRGNSL